MVSLLYKEGCASYQPKTQKRIRAILLVRYPSLECQLVWFSQQQTLPSTNMKSTFLLSLSTLCGVRGGAPASLSASVYANVTLSDPWHNTTWSGQASIITGFSKEVVLHGRSGPVVTLHNSMHSCGNGVILHADVADQQATTIGGFQLGPCDSVGGFSSQPHGGNGLAVSPTGDSVFLIAGDGITSFDINSGTWTNYAYDADKNWSNPCTDNSQFGWRQSLAMNKAGALFALDSHVTTWYHQGIVQIPRCVAPPCEYHDFNFTSGAEVVPVDDPAFIALHEATGDMFISTQGQTGLGYIVKITADGVLTQYTGGITNVPAEQRLLWSGPAAGMAVDETSGDLYVAVCERTGIDSSPANILRVKPCSKAPCPAEMFFNKSATATAPEALTVNGFSSLRMMSESAHGITSKRLLVASGTVIYSIKIPL